MIMEEILNGIDVSEHQGLIDWKKTASNGVQFAMLRCGYGRYESQKDIRFEQNYHGAKEAGIPVGAYLFSYATDNDMALQEAENCLSIIEGKQFEFPISYDVELSSQARLGSYALTAMVNTFCEKVESAGYYVSLYSSLDFVKNHFDMEKLKRYDLWLALWSSQLSYADGVGMWQHSSIGNIDGISGYVDLNKAYRDYPKIIKRAGLNGYQKLSGSSPVPTAGKKLNLVNAPLYSFSKAQNPSVYVNGTYYLYDGKPVNGRYRITNRPSSVEKRPMFVYVTGWIDGDAVNN